MSNNKILKDGQGLEFTTKTTEDVSGINTSHVNVDSLPITQPLTDVQLRATPIAITLPGGAQVNGPLTQTVINTDLLTGNINGWFDAATYQSCAIQIIASAGISAGQIIFEQTNDNSNTIGLPLLATEVIAVNTNPVNAAFVIAASSNRLFRCSINARYVRVRISTAFVGGNVRTIGFFSEFPFSANVMNIQQATAANLQTTVAGTVTATLAASTIRAGFIASSGIWYDDSAISLASNATFTGTSRDLTVTATASTFANAATFAKELRVSAETDVTGTLWLEVSRDNITWRRVKSIATSAVIGGGFYAEIIHNPSWRYARVGFTNGATIQTRLTVNSILIAI